MLDVKDLNIFQGDNLPKENAVYFITDPSLHEEIKKMDSDLLKLEATFPAVKFYRVDVSLIQNDEKAIKVVGAITNSIPTLYVIKLNSDKATLTVQMYRGTQTLEEMKAILNKLF